MAPGVDFVGLRVFNDAGSGYFNWVENALRWMIRFDGRPYDDVALTPFNGSTTTSSIVTLNSSRT